MEKENLMNVIRVELVNEEVSKELIAKPILYYDTRTTGN